MPVLYKEKVKTVVAQRMPLTEDLESIAGLLEWAEVVVARLGCSAACFHGSDWAKIVIVNPPGEENHNSALASKIPLVQQEISLKLGDYMVLDPKTGLSKMTAQEFESKYEPA